MDNFMTYASNMGNYSNSSTGIPLKENICEKPSDESMGLVKSLAVIYMFSSFASIIGSMSIIIYALIRKIIFNPEIHPLFHLSLADFCLAFGWFLTTILWWVNYDRSLESSKYCLYLEIVTEIFHIASFFLTVNYAAHVYFHIRQKAKEGVDPSVIFYKRMFTFLYGASWMLPIFLMLPMILHFKNKHFFDCSKCLMLFDRPKARLFNMTGDEITTSDNFGWRTYGSLLLILTLGTSITLLMVLYFGAMKMFTTVIKRTAFLSIQQRELIESNKKRVMLYVIIFLICWIPAFVVAFVDIIMENENYNFKNMYVIFLIEGIVTPAQGFFNSFVYGWSRHSFRIAGQGRVPYRQLLIKPGMISKNYGSSGQEA